MLIALIDTRLSRSLSRSETMQWFCVSTTGKDFKSHIWISATDVLLQESSEISSATVTTGYNHGCIRIYPSIYRQAGCKEPNLYCVLLCLREGAGSGTVYRGNCLRKEIMEAQEAGIRDKKTGGR